MSPRTIFLLVLGPLGALRAWGGLPPGRVTTVGWSVGALIGGASLVWTVLTVRRLMTWDRTEPLVAGPYAYGRHPMYLSMLGFVAAAAAMTGEVFLLISLPLLALGLDRWVIRSEEAELVEYFPEEYQRYQQQVRRWWGRARRSAEPE